MKKNEKGKGVGKETERVREHNKKFLMLFKSKQYKILGT